MGGCAARINAAPKPFLTSHCGPAPLVTPPSQLGLLTAPAAVPPAALIAGPLALAAAYCTARVGAKRAAAPGAAGGPALLGALATAALSGTAGWLLGMVAAGAAGVTGRAQVALQCALAVLALAGATALA